MALTRVCTYPSWLRAAGADGFRPSEVADFHRTLQVAYAGSERNDVIGRLSQRKSLRYRTRRGVRLVAMCELSGGRILLKALCSLEGAFAFYLFREKGAKWEHVLDWKAAGPGSVGEAGPGFTCYTTPSKSAAVLIGPGSGRTSPQGHQVCGCNYDNRSDSKIRQTELTSTKVIGLNTTKKVQEFDLTVAGVRYSPTRLAFHPTDGDTAVCLVHCVTSPTNSHVMLHSLSQNSVLQFNTTASVTSSLLSYSPDGARVLCVTSQSNAVHGVTPLGCQQMFVTVLGAWDLLPLCRLPILPTCVARGLRLLWGQSGNVVALAAWRKRVRDKSAQGVTELGVDWDSAMVCCLRRSQTRSQQEAADDVPPHKLTGAFQVCVYRITRQVASLEALCVRRLVISVGARRLVAALPRPLLRLLPYAVREDSGRGGAGW